MSAADTVLYDVPGPRARRRSLVGTVIASVVILALLGLVLKRLSDQGQFSMDLWGPFIDPSNESFGPVWNLLFDGLRATLVAAGLAIGLSLVVGTLLGSLRLLIRPAFRVPLIAFIELFQGPAGHRHDLLRVAGHAQAQDQHLAASPGLTACGTS